MLVALTLIVMLVVAAAFLREGLFPAFTRCCSVFLAGLAAFNFGEPLAGALEPLLRDSFLAGCADALSLVAVFSVALVLLRLATHWLVPGPVEFPRLTQRVGGALLGLLTGYLVAGFLLFALRTLPWDGAFLGERGRTPGGDPPGLFPPDRAWLTLMWQAGAYPPADEGGTSELRSGRLEPQPDRSSPGR